MKKKMVIVKLPENYPNKNLSNKKTEFSCKILNLKKPIASKIDDDFAKKIGAKDLADLKNLIKKQISSEYKRSLEAMTKKDILDQLDKSYDLELPKNLIDQETQMITQNQKKEDSNELKEKNLKVAKSRIKIGIILNQIAEKNNLKINENEIRNEIQKQIKNMPGQEKMVMDYYQKNPSAADTLRGALYEEKILNFIKEKIKLTKKSVSLKEAEEIIKKFSQANQEPKKSNISKNHKKLKNKKKK